MRVENEYNLFGYFWLSGEENHKIPGKLTISDRGEAELEMIGNFNQSDDSKIKRIIGTVEKWGDVTLDNCFYTEEPNKQYPPKQINVYKIFVHTVLAGSAWLDNEPIKLNSFIFTVDCLYEWIAQKDVFKTRDCTEHYFVKISYKKTEITHFSLDNGMQLKIYFDHKKNDYSKNGEFNITIIPYFVLESNESCELDEFISIASQINDFISFAMDTSVIIKDVSAKTPKKSTLPSDNKIKIFYQTRTFSKIAPKNIQSKMFFRFDSIAHNPSKFFNNWLNFHKKSPLSFSIYSSTRNGELSFIDNKFLSLVQG